MPIHVAATSYGIRCEFTGVISLDDIRGWSTEVRRLAQTRENFGYLSDGRTIVDSRTEASIGGANEVPAKIAISQETIGQLRANGLVRSAVVVKDRFIALKFKQTAFAAGNYEYERYLDGASDPQWERSALDWIERGIDPDRPGTTAMATGTGRG